MGTALPTVSARIKRQSFASSNCLTNWSARDWVDRATLFQFEFNSLIIDRNWFSFHCSTFYHCDLETIGRMERTTKIHIDDLFAEAEAEDFQLVWKHFRNPENFRLLNENFLEYSAINSQSILLLVDVLNSEYFMNRKISLMYSKCSKSWTFNEIWYFWSALYRTDEKRIHISFSTAQFCVNMKWFSTA